MTPAGERQRRLAYLAWVAVCLIWGTTYLGIRVCLESIPPMLMVGFRWLAAGLLLTAYLVARRVSLPPPARWPGAVLLGFLMIGMGNGGVVVSELWLPSGLAAVVVAACPFWMAAVEAFLPDGERLRAPIIAGLVIGFGGILVLVWPDLTTRTDGNTRFVAGVTALQIAAVGWALGSSYLKRHRHGNVLGTTAFQMIAGGVMTMIAGTVHGEWARLTFTPRTVSALVYLITAGAIGGYVAYIYALRHLPVTFVSLYAYINPIIAVALGILLLHERFDRRMAAAAALVLAGVAVVQWGSTEKGRTRPPADEPVGAGQNETDRPAL